MQCMRLICWECTPKGPAGVFNTNQQEYLIEIQALCAAESSHSIHGGSTLVPVRKGKRHQVGLSLPMELEPCAPKVKSKSLRTVCEFPRNWLQIGWPQEPLGAELRLG